MSPWLGWGLVGVAFVAGWLLYGWPGLALAVTVVVFWLLLQFSRSLRVLRDAGQTPVGHVDNAVMLHSRLKRGMRLMQVVALTHSLGESESQAPEIWSWHDAGGDRVRLTMQGGRLHEWALQRAAPDDEVPTAAP